MRFIELLEPRAMLAAHPFPHLASSLGGFASIAVADVNGQIESGDGYAVQLRILQQGALIGGSAVISEYLGGEIHSTASYSVSGSISRRGKVTLVVRNKWPESYSMRGVATANGGIAVSDFRSRWRAQRPGDFLAPVELTT